jgi:hypothetical protein
VVTDPTHPLFGKSYPLSGLATLPGNVRHCHVEIRSGQYGYVAIASTNMATGIPPSRTLLTPDAITDLVTLFQSVSRQKRSKNANHRR